MIRLEEFMKDLSIHESGLHNPSDLDILKICVLTKADAISYTLDFPCDRNLSGVVDVFQIKDHDSCIVSNGQVCFDKNMNNSLIASCAITCCLTGFLGKKSVRLQCYTLSPEKRNTLCKANIVVNDVGIVITRGVIHLTK